MQIGSARRLVMGVCSLLLRDWRRGALVATALVAGFALFGALALDAGIGCSSSGSSSAGWGSWWPRSWSRSAPAAVAAHGDDGAQRVHAGAGRSDPAHHRALRVGPSGMASRARTTPRTSSPSRRRGSPERDIYLIVLDRYGSDWSHRAPLRYPGRRPARLARRPGLPGLPGARANYRATDFSLASMLSHAHARRVSATRRPGLRRPDARPRTPRASRGRRRSSRTTATRYYHSARGGHQRRPTSWRTRSLACGEDTEFEAVLRDVHDPAAVEQALGRSGEAEGFRGRDDATRRPCTSSASSSAWPACQAASSCSPTSCCPIRRTCSTRKAEGDTSGRQGRTAEACRKRSCTPTS